MPQVALATLTSAFKLILSALFGYVQIGSIIINLCTSFLSASATSVTAFSSPQFPSFFLKTVLTVRCIG